MIALRMAACSSHAVVLLDIVTFSAGIVVVIYAGAGQL